MHEPPSDLSSSSCGADQVPPLSATESEASNIRRRTLLKGAAASAVSLGAFSALALPGNVSAAPIHAGSPIYSHRAPVITDTPPTLIPSAPALVEFPRGGQLHEYWFQADSFYHNIMPSGVDGMTGNIFTPDQTSYWAIGYRAFTPGWGQPLPGDSDIGVNTGLPGPIIRGQVGDTFRVHFRNNDTYYKVPHTISVHALYYTPENDGGWSWMLRDRPGTAVQLGESYTYEWQAIPRSLGTWPYHDHSQHFDPGRGTMVMEAGAELGLFGMIIITDQSTPAVDNEITSIWHSLYQGDIPGLSQDFHCFDGRAYLGNTPTIHTKVGQRIRWRVVGLGNDFHTFHMHGHTWWFNGRYDDSVVFGPGATLTLEYIEDAAPGLWYYHCHVTEHVMGPGMGGMIGLISVEA